MYLYQSLESDIEQRIVSGAWKQGHKLPSVRAMCAQKQLSKATVIHAYQRLEAKGLIAARTKSGFYVSHQMRESHHLKPQVPYLDATPALVDTSDLMRDVMEHGAAFDLCPHIAKDQPLSAAQRELNRAIARTLRKQNSHAHAYYDEPSGVYALREVIAERYARLGCHVDPQEITITAGCQHALFIALSATCTAGDIVAVESPGFYGVLQLLESMGLKALEIPVSTDTGISVDALHNAAKKWPIKACVVSPAFATPTGANMPEESKRALLACAEVFNFTIIEDDIYGDLAFTERPSPIKSWDAKDHVILCGSFSKSLSRDLRIGWVITKHQREIKRHKLVSLLATGQYMQEGLANFITNGEYDRHLRKMRTALMHQKDQLLSLLNEYWHKLGQYRISQPQGGLALWLELPAEYDVASCYLKAREQGVLITPGSLFTAQARYQHCLRLSFAHEWDINRVNALITLAKILKTSCS